MSSNRLSILLAGTFLFFASFAHATPLDYSCWLEAFMIDPRATDPKTDDIQVSDRRDLRVSPSFTGRAVLHAPNPFLSQPSVRAIFRVQNSGATAQIQLILQAYEENEDGVGVHVLEEARIHGNFGQPSLRIGVYRNVHAHVNCWLTSPLKHVTVGRTVRIRLVTPIGFAG